MNDQTPHHSLPDAAEDLERCQDQAATPQTQSPSYRLSFADADFLLSDDLRGVRLMLEYMKPEQVMRDASIDSTIVIFGSARVTASGSAPSARDASPSLQVFYDEARQFARLVSERYAAADGEKCVVVTGGGPGIMEAANRGAADAGAKSIGLNIVLPREQAPNPWITPELNFQFHYFALRKLHFLMRARALAAFPGGFGTLDELFETLTLLQTRRIAPMPVLLFGRAYWERIINFAAMVELGVISAADLSLFRFVENADEAMRILQDSGLAATAPS